jgi:integrase
MGTIIERPRKDGITYQAIIKIPGAKAIVKSFPAYEQAEAFMGSIEADRAKYSDLQQTRLQKEQARVASLSKGEVYDVFLNEWLRETLKLYAANAQLAVRQQKIMPTLLKNIGDVKIGEIKKKWGRDFVSKMRNKKTYRGTPYSYATILILFQVIQMAVRWRAEEFDIDQPRLPLGDKLFPKHWEVKRERRLERHEELALMARIRSMKKGPKHHWRLLVKLAIETAARQQELILANWSEFDLVRKVWMIPAAHTKTKQSRVVPLSLAAMRMLKVLKLISNQEDRRVFEVFSSPAVVCAVFRKLVKSCDIIDFRFHDLRHEAISRMVIYKRHLTIYQIMQMVGHSTMDMVRHYSNLRVDEIAGLMH